MGRTQVLLCTGLSELPAVVPAFSLPFLCLCLCICLCICLCLFTLPLTLLLPLPNCHPRALASNWLRPVCLLFSLLWSIRPNGLSSGRLWGTLHWSTNDAPSVYGHLISMSAPLKWLMFRSGSQRPSKVLKKYSRPREQTDKLTDCALDSEVPPTQLSKHLYRLDTRLQCVAGSSYSHMCNMQSKFGLHQSSALTSRSACTQA